MRHEHPDANLLTAFAEKRLSAREREAMLAHLAQCADCRAIVALASEAAPAATARSISPAWRWAAGIAAAVLVLTGAWGLRLVLWSPPANHTEPLVAMTRETAMAPNPPTAGIPAQPEMAPASKREARAVLRKPAKQPPAPKQQEKPRDFPPEQFLAPMPKGAIARPVTKNFGLVASKAMLPRPQVLWRVTGHSLEHSIDAGTTWQPLSVAEGAEFHAVASQGSDVWAGGTHGALFHSSDAGETWSEVEVSEGEALKGNIVSIRLPETAEVSW